MTSDAHDVWKNIIGVLENNLQYGLLKQLKAVVDVRLEGSHVKLFVASAEAYDFFTRDINQQRLKIASRSFFVIESIEVEKIEAEPIT